MPLTPEELGNILGPEVRELVEHISKAKRAIKDIQEAYGLRIAEKKLKARLQEMIPPDENGHHTILVDGVKAKVYMRKGREKVNKEAATRLLHPNTYRAIFSQGEPYPVLEVDPARIPPALDWLFVNNDDDDDDDDDYYG
jgi:hypothetical protein